MGTVIKGGGVSLYVRDDKIIIRLDNRENMERTVKTQNKIYEENSYVQDLLIFVLWRPRPDSDLHKVMCFLNLTTKTFSNELFLVFSFIGRFKKRKKEKKKNVLSIFL